MDAIRKKSEDSVANHRTLLVVGGILIAVGAGCKAAHVYHRKTCIDWALNGLVIGFHEAINWFDEEFAELNLRKLYNEWAETHPEEIMYV